MQTDDLYEDVPDVFTGVSNILYIAGSNCVQYYIYIADSNCVRITQFRLVSKRFLIVAALLMIMVSTSLFFNLTCKSFEGFGEILLVVFRFSFRNYDLFSVHSIKRLFSMRFSNLYIYIYIYIKSVLTFKTTFT